MDLFKIIAATLKDNPYDVDHNQLAGKVEDAIKVVMHRPASGSPSTTNRSSRWALVLRIKSQTDRINNQLKNEKALVERNACLEVLVGELQETVEGLEGRNARQYAKLQNREDDKNQLQRVNNNLRATVDQLKCAMDQSQTILELEKGMASQAEAFMDGSQRITINPRPARDNPFDGKFDKVIMDPQHVEHLKAIINGEPVDVVPDPKNGRIDELQERIEKLETHNDNLKAKVRRVVEESSNLEEALIKVARGH